MFKKSMATTAVAAVFCLTAAPAGATVGDYYPPSTPEGQYWYGVASDCTVRWMSAEVRANKATSERNQFEALSINQAQEITGLNSSLNELGELYNKDEAQIDRLKKTVARLRARLQS